jgi:hypothetical protein
MCGKSYDKGRAGLSGCCDFCAEAMRKPYRGRSCAVRGDIATMGHTSWPATLWQWGR